MSKNIWKNMETSKLYEALKSMTPEERLKDLFESQKKLGEAISKSIEDDPKEDLFNYINNYIEDLKPEYEDYSFPYEALLSEAEDIIHDMIETDKFYDLMKNYIRSIL